MHTNMNDQAFLNLEKQYWQAMGNNDVEAAVALTKFPCIVAGPQGLLQVNESEYRKIMAKQRGDAYKDVELQDPKVRMLNEQTAIVAYTVLINGMKMLDVSTWIKDGTEWSCAFHSENPIKN